MEHGWEVGLDKGKAGLVPKNATCQKQHAKQVYMLICAVFLFYYFEMNSMTFTRV